jgi:hypothetical protein
MVYVDSSKPELVEGFTKKTFTAMIEGVRQSAIDEGIIDSITFDNGFFQAGGIPAVSRIGDLEGQVRKVRRVHDRKALRRMFLGYIRTTI